jgi:GMP synthase-like glutamine amidotransferase
LEDFRSARIGDVSEDRLRGLVLQLQEEAPSGLLEGWAARRDIALDVAPIEAGAPDPSSHAFAVVLGSGKSLAQDSPDWARDVLDWVRAADAAQVPVLGICFGAQALAAAFGGSVHRLAAPEIGWVDVVTNDADRVPAGPWLAWHEDGLRPPPLAYELASNRFGTQAFCLRRHLAVQFHPEATADIVASWAAMPHSRVEETGQTAEGLVAECREQADAAAARAERLFDGFAARAGLAPPVAT